MAAEGRDSGVYLLPVIPINMASDYVRLGSRYGRIYGAT